ncbi:uncharacterized protein [Dysidea avara]|uniref:uncharacterized protein isoform X2 n=1 Tax=Dysidea avara TaxID=196820 RepID=UPI0033265914
MYMMPHRLTLINRVPVLQELVIACGSLPGKIKVQFSVVKCTWTVVINIKDSVDLQVIGHSMRFSRSLAVPVWYICNLASKIKVQFSVVKCIWTVLTSRTVRISRSPNVSFMYKVKILVCQKFLLPHRQDSSVLVQSQLFPDCTTKLIPRSTMRFIWPGKILAWLSMISFRMRHTVVTNMWVMYYFIVRILLLILQTINGMSFVM